MVTNGCRAQGSSNPETGLHPPLPQPTQSFKVSHSHKQLCQSSQEQLPVRSIAAAYRQKCCRTGSQPNIPRVFQPAVFSAQTQQQMEAYFRPKQTESLPQDRKIQNGNTGNHQNIPSARGVGNLSRLQGCLLPHTHTGTIQEISQISCPRSDIPIQGSSLWSVHSSHGVHCNSQGGETDGRSQGYKNPPVPRRLVGEGQLPLNLLATHTKPGQNVSETSLASEYRKIRTGAKTSLQLRRLPVRPQVRPGQTHSGPVAKPSGQNKMPAASTGLSGPAVHVLDRPTNSHRKTGSLRPTAHETHTVASQKQLESTGISRKDYPSPQVTAPTLAMVATGQECTPRPTLTPHKTCSANFYRRIKRRVGRSLKRAHCKGVLVSARKQTAYKLSRAESSPPSLKRVSGSLCRQNSSSGNRQYDSSCLHKQGSRHEIGPSVCSTMENLDLVFLETSNPNSPTHPRPSKCDSGQAIQAGSDHPDGVVPPSRSFSEIMQQMAPASSRSVCQEIQPQVTSVCVSSSGLPSCSSGCTHSAMGGSGCICLPTDRHLGQSGGKVTGLPVQETHSNRPRVAQHALVLGLGDHVQSSSPQLTKSAQSADTALQSDPSQKSDKSKPSSMAPRATVIKKQGFSEAVAARIEAPQRRSTRSVYEAKWAIFTKWCVTNQVDFRSPPIKSMADFLLRNCSPAPLMDTGLSLLINWAT